jgi:hypothetical protein
MGEAGQAYHMPFGWLVKGKLDGWALRRALDRILQRHEALRTTFILRDERPLQRIGAGEDLRFRLLE